MQGLNFLNFLIVKSQKKDTNTECNLDTLRNVPEWIEFDDEHKNLS